MCRVSYTLYLVQLDIALDIFFLFQDGTKASAQREYSAGNGTWDAQSYELYTYHEVLLDGYPHIVVWYGRLGW